MADVANEDRREIYNKLSEWERTDRPLAPLSSKQYNIILELSEEVSTPYIPVDVSDFGSWFRHVNKLPIALSFQLTTYFAF